MNMISHKFLITKTPIRAKSIKYKVVIMELTLLLKLQVEFSSSY